MKRLIFSLSLIAALANPSALFAADIWEMADSEEYGKKAGGMLGRGLVNAGSCFVDLAVHTVEGTKQGPPVVGTLGGIGTGAACTVIRAASGVMDVATFWVPGFNGIPVSRSYSDCLNMSGTHSKRSFASSSSQRTTGSAARNSNTAPPSDFEPVTQKSSRSTGSQGSSYIAPKSSGSSSSSSVKTPSSQAKTAIKDVSSGAHDPMEYVKK